MVLESIRKPVQVLSMKTDEVQCGQSLERQNDTSIAPSLSFLLKSV